jgi:hypothetical protein
MTKDWLDGLNPDAAVEYCQRLLDEARHRGLIDTNVDMLLAANPAMRAAIEQEIGRDVVLELMFTNKPKRGRPPKGERKRHEIAEHDDAYERHRKADLNSKANAYDRKRDAELLAKLKRFPAHLAATLLPLLRRK